MCLQTSVTVEVPISVDVMAAVKKADRDTLVSMPELRLLITDVVQSVIQKIKEIPGDEYQMLNLTAARTPTPPLTIQASPLRDDYEDQASNCPNLELETPHESTTVVNDERGQHVRAASTTSSSPWTWRKVEAQIIKAITAAKTQNLHPANSVDKEEVFFKMEEHKALDFLQIQPASGLDHSGVFEIAYEVYRRDCMVVDQHSAARLQEQLRNIPWKRCGDFYQDLDEANSAAAKELRRRQPDMPKFASPQGFEVRQESSDDGTQYYCLEYDGVGIVEAVVLEKLLCEIDEQQEIYTEDNWDTLPIYFVRSRGTTDVARESDSTVGETIVYLDLDSANEEAINLWVELTCGFQTALERQDKLQTLLRRAQGQRGCFKAKTSATWAVPLEVWVETGSLVGPSASLRKQSLRSSADEALST